VQAKPEQEPKKKEAEVKATGGPVQQKKEPNLLCRNA
jgi:hypothetical protein